LAHIEKVGAQAAGLECEFTKTQHVALQGEFDKVALIVVHGGFPTSSERINVTGWAAGYADVRRR
jgi:hypothetical protein